MKAKILSVINLVNKFFKVNEYNVEIDSFNGEKIIQTRILLERGNSAACLLYDKINKKVLFIEQFRIGGLFTENPWQLEIIAGMIDQKDISSVYTIIREIKEESGITVFKENLTKIFSGFPSVGGSSEIVDIYVADVDLSNVVNNSLYGLKTESEDIRIKIFSFEEIFKLKNELKINQMSSMIALQWLEKNLN